MSDRMWLVHRKTGLGFLLAKGTPGCSWCAFESHMDADKLNAFFELCYKFSEAAEDDFVLLGDLPNSPDFTVDGALDDKPYPRFVIKQPALLSEGKILEGLTQTFTGTYLYASDVTPAQINDHGFTIGHVPAGTMIVRYATDDDWRGGNITRALLVKEPDERFFWLHSDGREKELIPPTPELRRSLFADW